MKPAVEGIMYPIGAKAELSSSLPPVSGHRFEGPYMEVPHAAWAKCKSVLDKAFYFETDPNVAQVFVLAPLHKGTVCLDETDLVYAPLDGELAGSDWKISLQTPPVIAGLISFSDDICSEESSLEIIAPYLSVRFPNARVCWLLATPESRNVKRIVEIIGKDFPFSPIFISNNMETGCAAMWKEAFRP